MCYSIVQYLVTEFLQDNCYQDKSYSDYIKGKMLFLVFYYPGAKLQASTNDSAEFIYPSTEIYAWNIYKYYKNSIDLQSG